MTLALWLLGVAPTTAAEPLSGMISRSDNSTCLAGDRPTSPQDVTLRPVFGQLSTLIPFYLQQSPVELQRWYSASRNGKIYTFLTPSGAPELALDIGFLIGVLNQDNAYAEGGSEHWGLASFTFDPQFSQNKFIYVLYNGRKANESVVTSAVVRFTLGSDGKTFVPSSLKRIISQAQTNPGVNHHWGQVAFGPDGYLYIGSGDGTNGAPASLPLNPAQKCSDLRGKILRIDVHTTAAYLIPPSNPFAANTTCRKEIYALGFRNPWRFSFDSSTGQLWVSDVGAGAYEEIDKVEKVGNYGWPLYEGPQCHIPDQCDTPSLMAPIDATEHNQQPAAIIGGYVYRGKAIPALYGEYIYNIYPQAPLNALRSQGNGSYVRRILIADAPDFVSYFVDRQGELYGITGHLKKPIIYKFVRNTSSGVVDPPIPALLSQTGCVDPEHPQNPRSGLIPYTVISPLWSDGASKRRWAALPNGKTITIGNDGDFKFPVGTVLMKEFSFQGKAFETRLLKRHNDGTWAGYSYEWRGDQSDASLVDGAGKTKKVAVTPTLSMFWSYPSRADCMACHTEAANYALGPEIAQLNNFNPARYPQTQLRGNQLATWNAIGLFDPPLAKPVADLPSMVDPRDTTQSTIRRVRSYLHANCSGCHRPQGPTRSTIDFRYITRIDKMNLCGAVPVVSDLDVDGAKLLYPEHPELSVLSLRMAMRGGNQMPPLGTTRLDGAAINMIRSWISQSHVCDVVGDADGDGVPNNADNCSATFNPNQADNDGDRIGNRCDGDFSNDLRTDATERNELFARLGAVFRRGPLWHDKYDLNSDALIDATDLSLFDQFLSGARPGPSGVRKLPSD